jgi:hypothetical protein
MESPYFISKENTLDHNSTSISGYIGDMKECKTILD